MATKDFDLNARYETLFGLLLESQRASEILMYLAQIIWLTVHKEECPQNQIPSVQTLQRWWKNLGTDHGQPQREQQRNTQDDKPLERVILNQDIFYSTEMVRGDISDEGVESTHKNWLVARQQHLKNGKSSYNGYDMKHPLADIIKAWQQRLFEVHSTADYDSKRPAAIMRFPRGNFDLELFSDNDAGSMLRRFADDSVLPDLQMVLPRIHRKSVIRDPNKVFLAHVGGVNKTTRPGAVSPELRIFVEAIMQIPPGQRLATIRIKLNDLIERLYPEGFHWTNQSPKLLAAIHNIDRLTVPFLNSNGNIQRGYAPVKLNTMDFQRRNDDVIFTVTLPQDVTGGPMVEKEKVRLIGLYSDPKWHAYLALCDLFHRYGVYPRKKSKYYIWIPTKPVERRNNEGHLLNVDGQVIHDARGNPVTDAYSKEGLSQLDREDNQKAIDKYPVVPFDDMLKECFPGKVFNDAKDRNTYLVRAKEHFKALAGEVPIKKKKNIFVKAIKIIEHADGWQFLPGDSHIQTYKALTHDRSNK